MPIRMIKDPSNPSTDYQLLKVRIVHFFDSRVSSTKPINGVFPLMLDNNSFVNQLINEGLITSFERYDIAKSKKGFVLALRSIASGYFCREVEGPPYLAFKAVSNYALNNPIDKFDGGISPEYIDKHGIVCIQFVYKPNVTLFNFFNYSLKLISTGGLRVNKRYPVDMKKWAFYILRNPGLVISKNKDTYMTEPTALEIEYQYNKISRSPIPNVEFCREIAIRRINSL